MNYRLVEVLRCHSNNYGAVQRVSRLSRHLAEHVPAQAPVSPRRDYRPSKLDHRLSDETIGALIHAYEAGATTREVGQRFKLAHSSVNKLLKQHDVQARRRSPSDGEVRSAMELYAAGLSTRVIGQHLGFGASTIARALVKAGVMLRSR